MGLLGIGLLGMAGKAAGQMHRGPGIDAYLLDEAYEISLALSAAPSHVTDHAEVRVLRRTGYETVREGSNGFVCMVMRSWALHMQTAMAGRGPDAFWDLRDKGPVCFNPPAAETIARVVEFKAELVARGASMEEIDREVARGFAGGRWKPAGETLGLGYMMSSDMWVGAAGGEAPPHMMIYAPYMTPELAGGENRPGPWPYVVELPGAPHAIMTVFVAMEAIDPKPVERGR